MSISNDEVAAMIKAHMAEADITVQGDGYKYEATVVSQQFQGLNTVKRHKMVYDAVNEAIRSGQLHALTIKAHTPEEI